MIWCGNCGGTCVASVDGGDGDDDDGKEEKPCCIVGSATGSAVVVDVGISPVVDAAAFVFEDEDKVAIGAEPEMAVVAEVSFSVGAGTDADGKIIALHRRTSLTPVQVTFAQS